MASILFQSIKCRPVLLLTDLEERTLIVSCLESALGKDTSLISECPPVHCYFTSFPLQLICFLCKRGSFSFCKFIKQKFNFDPFYGEYKLLGGILKGSMPEKHWVSVLACWHSQISTEKEQLWQFWMFSSQYCRKYFYLLIALEEKLKGKFNQTQEFIHDPSTPVVIESWVKFCNTQILSGALQQNYVATFSWTTEVDGDLF